MPLGKAWAWTGEDVKSFSEILRQCVQCVCGDGNYLRIANIGSQQLQARVVTPITA